MSEPSKSRARALDRRQQRRCHRLGHDLQALSVRTHGCRDQTAYIHKQVAAGKACRTVVLSCVAGVLVTLEQPRKSAILSCAHAKSASQALRMPG
jgi:transposase